MNDDDSELIEGMRRAQEAMKPKPHPDTARADAAERLLAGVMETIPVLMFGGDAFYCVCNECDGLRDWWTTNKDRLSGANARARRIATLAAERDRLDAEREQVERELAALEGRK